MDTFLKQIPHKFSANDEALMIKALTFSIKAHEGQKRRSGDDFVDHPIAAAGILGQIFPDTTTIIATLLHDIPEDTEITLDTIKKEFGNEVALLVDGVTKLGRVRLLNSQDKYYVENLRKMFIATSQDVRVMIIKLADRMHNIRTIEHLPREKQLKVANETLEMYAPIAGRLGIGTWKDELEDRSFAVVYHE
jgi:GTP diphosphokinase / guanosine-3',5'-bis(diphosphate) 3'-diphosphatase